MVIDVKIQNIIFFLQPCNEIAFFSAALGIIFNTAKYTESFLGGGDRKTAVGHSDDISCSAISPDRMFLATG